MTDTRRYEGLLELAKRLHVAGIHTEPVPALSLPKERRFVFRAIVYTAKDCKGFVAFGEADPASIPAELHGCELRIAETRAIRRALTKAYHLDDRPPERAEGASPSTAGPRPVRERFAHVAARLGVTPEVLKGYARVFCEAKSLRLVGPERLARFLDHVEAQAGRDRDGLLALIAEHAPTGGTQ